MIRPRFHARRRRTEDLPVPPVALIDRTGRGADFPPEQIAANPWLADPVESYQRLGVAIRDQLLTALPDDWTFEGKRVLEFGCGSGRVLRQLIDQARHLELWGCDIDSASVQWLQSHMSPLLRVVPNAETPPLDLPSGQFDLIYAVSVFTHLTDTWSAWLLELHRLLAEDGLFVASFHGPGVRYALERLPWHEPYDEDRIGMHVVGEGTPWSEGGPSVIHSRWWLNAHWGRAFELIKLMPGEHGGQGWFVGRRRSIELTPADLERLESREPREAEALQYSLRQAHAEVRAIRPDSNRR